MQTMMNKIKDLILGGYLWDYLMKIQNGFLEGPIGWETPLNEVLAFVFMDYTLWACVAILMLPKLKKRVQQWNAERKERKIHELTDTINKVLDERDKRNNGE